jgi:hypothetical protein
MKLNFIISIILAFCFQTVNGQTVSPLSKERTIKLYDSLYVTSEIDTIVWNGSLSTCSPGSLSTEFYIKAENRINFFRLVNGLNEIQNNPELNKDAQNAALLVKANNQLTHYAKSTMKCYSKSAANGCLKSCLGFTDWTNFPKTAFVSGFICDFGDANYFVGHRKWLLYSKLSEFGYGATNTSEAILTADGVNYGSVNTPSYVAYPWNGFVPVDLIFPKWSFSIPESDEVDYSNTTITMKDSKGVIIETKKLKEYKNYLDHTLVWTAKGLFTDYEIQYGQNNLEENGYLDKKIKVEISRVIVNGETKNFVYYVEPIKIKTLPNNG